MTARIFSPVLFIVLLLPFSAVGEELNPHPVPDTTKPKQGRVIRPASEWVPDSTSSRKEGDAYRAVPTQAPDTSRFPIPAQPVPLSPGDRRKAGLIWDEVEPLPEIPECDPETGSKVAMGAAAVGGLALLGKYLFSVPVPVAKVAGALCLFLVRVDEVMDFNDRLYEDMVGGSPSACLDPSSRSEFDSCVRSSADTVLCQIEGEKIQLARAKDGRILACRVAENS